MHKRGLTFEQLLRQGMIHQVLANDRFWTHQPNVLIQRYEEILADPMAASAVWPITSGSCWTKPKRPGSPIEYSLESNKARTEALASPPGTGRDGSEYRGERPDLRLEHPPALESCPERRLFLVRRGHSASATDPPTALRALAPIAELRAPTGRLGIGAVADPR